MKNCNVKKNPVSRGGYRWVQITQYEKTLSGENGKKSHLETGEVVKQYHHFSSLGHHNVENAVTEDVHWIKATGNA